MASTLATPDAQGLLLFEDLDVYFSQEECVSLQPDEESPCGDDTQEGSRDLDLMGREIKTEDDQQLSPEIMEPEELSLEKYSIKSPPAHYPENPSEDDDGVTERKIPGPPFTCKKKFISLLVTIENQTPLVELSHCLGVRTLSDILEVPWEEAKTVHQCPDCDQSFSDSTYLVLHQKIHSREKKHKCGDCGKTFSHGTNLKTHRRVHTGEKPYKCTRCAASFRQQSHLSRHMDSHAKEKTYTCSICGRGFMWLPGLAEHQKSHTDKKSQECPGQSKRFHQEKTGTPDTPHQYAQCVKRCEQPSPLVLPDKDHKENSEQCSVDDENFFSFSRFKPLQCLECDMTFPCFSELVSHQNVHDMEKIHKCKICAKAFALDSELASHQKSHAREEPFKCPVCGKSFRVNVHLIAHKRSHRRK